MSHELIPFRIKLRKSGTENDGLEMMACISSRVRAMTYSKAWQYDE